MSDVELDYDYLTQRALKQVVRDVLSTTAELGAAPGRHHFFVEFDMSAPGVDVPDNLRESYPERMTVVLQHQFENLFVDSEHFEVTLWFKGVEARLSIPFEAVTSFADPSVQFGLRFDLEPEEEEGPPPVADRRGGEDDAALDQSAPAKSGEPSDDNVAGGEKAADDSADVVSLDAFRKK